MTNHNNNSLQSALDTRVHLRTAWDRPAQISRYTAPSADGVRQRAHSLGTSILSKHLTGT
jgi:hypothetical protein